MQPTNPNPEQTPAGMEQPQPQLEASPQASQAAPVNPAPVNPLPAPPPAAKPAQEAATHPKTATPAQAEDVDVIEKEWVDAAQKAVHDHADDPHAEEEAFEDLQVDYLKKRYGKDIKKPQE